MADLMTILTNPLVEAVLLGGTGYLAKTKWATIKAVAGKYIPSLNQPARVISTESYSERFLREVREGQEMRGRRASMQPVQEHAAHAVQPVQLVQQPMQRPMQNAADALNLDAPMQTRVQNIKLSTVANADNVLVVGQKNAGKTTLLRKILATRATEELYALDPHAKPGKWPCTTVGAGRDYAAIGNALVRVEAGMDARFKQMATGEIDEGAFPRRSVVTDEYRSISEKLNGKAGEVDAGNLMLNRISEGRKVGECALVACHNDTGEALGIKGNTDMKTCFDFIIYMGGLVESQRTQSCPQDIKAEALKQERPAVAWLTEKNQWFVLQDDLPMPEVSIVSRAGTTGTTVPVRTENTQNAGTEPSYQYRTSTVPQDEAEMQLSHDINILHNAGISWNKIGEQLELKGQKQQRNARIRQALGLPNPAETEFVDAD